MTYSPEEVFKPGAFPNLTYVSRYSDSMGMTYEDRLRIALKKTGFLTYIAGSSKMGKTVLCRKVIPENSLVCISGADFNTNEDVWSVIARWTPMPIEGSLISEVHTDGQLKTTTSNTFKSTKEGVIAYFKQNNKTLLIDDFQYTAPDRRQILVQQLKDAIGKEFQVIVVSLPHRADEAIRLNPDLSGRISMINLKAWEDSDLKEIAKKGFEQLGVVCSDELMDLLAQESLSSPQLLQSICLNIGILLQDKGPLEGAHLTKELCYKAFRWTTSNFEYIDVARALKTGPVARGTKRNKYKSKSGKLEDLYELILDSLATDPPVTSIKISALKERINDLLDKNEVSTPSLVTIKNSLNHLLTIMNQKETELFKVFDIKDNNLYILDPQFLFYLRWGDRSDE